MAVLMCLVLGTIRLQGQPLSYPLKFRSKDGDKPHTEDASVGA